MLLLVVFMMIVTPRGVHAQEGSGATVKDFLAALDRGDIDAALAKWVSNPEVEVAGGETYTTLETVRAYFEAFPRPIEVRATLPWGGRRYEACVIADGTPLLLTFLGADGAIAHMYVEPDPGSDLATSDLCALR